MYNVEDLTELAKRNGASDIHLVCGLPPKYRLDGQLENMADERLAEKLVRDLYENGRLDVTAYEPADVDFLFEEDSEDFEEEDEDFDDEDMLNVYFADDDTDGIHIPRTIRFPKNRD